MGISRERAIHWLRVLEQEQIEKRDPACPEVWDEAAEALRMAIMALEGTHDPQNGGLQERKRA